MHSTGLAPPDRLPGSPLCLSQLSMFFSSRKPTGKPAPKPKPKGTCKFGAHCKKKATCPFSHTGPPPAIPGGFGVCHYGADCRRAYCPFTHPAESSAATTVRPAASNARDVVHFINAAPSAKQDGLQRHLQRYPGMWTAACKPHSFFYPDVLTAVDILHPVPPAGQPAACRVWAEGQKLDENTDCVSDGNAANPHSQFGKSQSTYTELLSVRRPLPSFPRCMTAPWRCGSRQRNSPAPWAGPACSASSAC